MPIRSVYVDGEHVWLKFVCLVIFINKIVMMSPCRAVADVIGAQRVLAPTLIVHGRNGRKTQ